MVTIRALLLVKSRHQAQCTHTLLRLSGSFSCPHNPSTTQTKAPHSASFLHLRGLFGLHSLPLSFHVTWAHACQSTFKSNTDSQDMSGNKREGEMLVTMLLCECVLETKREKKNTALTSLVLHAVGVFQETVENVTCFSDIS